jgi:hypothetical protein
MPHPGKIRVSCLIFSSTDHVILKLYFVRVVFFYAALFARDMFLLSTIFFFNGTCFAEALRMNTSVDRKHFSYALTYSVRHNR